MKQSIILFSILSCFAFSNHNSYARSSAPDRGELNSPLELGDDSAPSLVSRTPSHLATNVSINSSFILAFDQEIQAGPEGINPSLILKYINGNTVEFISLTGDQAVFDGNTLTVTPTDPLLYFQTYYIEIPNGVIEDMDNNDYAGFTGSTTWNFQTEPSPFESQELSPAPNATDVSPTTDLSITFNKNADIGAGNITIYNASNDQPVETLQNYNGAYMTIDGATITFNPIDDLPENTTFYVQVSNAYLRTSGPPTQYWDGIQDETTWTFTTGAAPDTEVPTVTSTVPADDATDVAVDFGTFVINCSEPIQISETPGMVGEDYYLEIKFSSTTIKQFDVTDPNDVEIIGSQILLKNIPELDFDKNYQVRYYNYVSQPFEDLAGNKLGSYNNSTAFWFLTEEGDQIAPYATSTSPADEGTYAPLNASGGIVFSEDILEGTGTIELYLADGTLVESIPVGEGDPRLTQPGTFRIAWDFDQDLIPSTDYYILVSEGAYEDLAGNPFAGIGLGDLDFTANARPKISSLSPTDGATNVAKDASLTLSLDMSVYVGDELNLVIREYDTDNEFETFALHDLNMGFGAGEFPNGIITVTPTSNFASETEYYVVLEGTGNLISSSNVEVFVGLDDKDDWTFTSQIIDSTAPQLLSVTPADNSSFDPEARVLTMTFDEPIRFGSNTLAYFKIYREDGSDYINTLFSEEDDRVSISGNVATVTFSGPEWTAGSYYVTLSNEAIEDFSENQFEGFSDPTFWNFTVNDLSKTNQTITFNTIEDISYGESISLSATASSELPVDFIITEGENLVSRNGSELTAIGVGTVTVQASQDGDESFNPAEAVTRSFSINKASQIITIEPIADKLTTDDPFEVVASIDTELTLNYNISGPATNDENTITLTGVPGTVTLTISQAGNENYLEASESVSFEVNEEETALSVNPQISIAFYPNPVIDQLTIETSEIVDIRIINLNGKILMHKEMSYGMLDLGSLANGTYLLEIKTKHFTQRKKIIKAN